MALKRVSDLEHKTLSDITTYINDMYGNGVNMEKLPKSLIEVSEVLDQHHSQYESYAYDLQALSAIFIDGVLNRDITFTGNKTFNGDIDIKGTATIEGETTINDKTTITGDTVIKGKTIISGDAEIYSDFTKIKIKDGFQINAEDENGEIITLFSVGKSSAPGSSYGMWYVNMAADIIDIIPRNRMVVFKPKDGTWGQYDNGSDASNTMFRIWKNDNDIYKCDFKQTSQANPINGYINHALWS